MIKLVCSDCAGEGGAKCDNCFGTGDCYCSGCEAEHECGWCEGEGSIDCGTCKGSGEVWAGGAPSTEGEILLCSCGRPAEAVLPADKWWHDDRAVCSRCEAAWATMAYYEAEQRVLKEAEQRVLCLG